MSKHDKIFNKINNIYFGNWVRFTLQIYYYFDNSRESFVLILFAVRKPFFAVFNFLTFEKKTKRKIF